MILLVLIMKSLLLIIVKNNGRSHVRIMRSFSGTLSLSVFVHEDVKFHSVGWGKCIEKKLKEPDCGII